MDLPRPIRILIGLVAILLTIALLYLMWQLYSYFYLNKKKKEKPPPKPEPPVEEKTYHRPTFVYDDEKHEFYIKDDS